jgi:predicted CopG family antitoxin
MATKTLNIAEDAYKRLAALKKENESFTDVIYRVTGKYELYKLVGILSKEKAEELRKHTKEFSKKMTDDFERRHKRFK